ncbi:MAG TPA: F0F1 ATP synthase subunit A [Candidatus Saccharibacteria bacterium]|nr:F0F1 ATP synthase subunit A [Candidatus Saccharibacteria bacterium]
MGSIFTTFAAEGIHVSLKAEPIQQAGNFVITNAIIYGVLCTVLLGIILLAAARRSAVKPSKSILANSVEWLVEYVITLLEGPFGSREKAAKYTPYFATFFFYIMFSNLMGLLPLVGPAIHVEGTPLFRPMTADLNGTVALSVVAILLVQILSIKEQGVKGHLKHYFSDKPWNPINFFIGILEVLGELTRIISLSLRLFLNTAVGEILIAVFTSMIAPNGMTPFAVIPIFMFEMLVAGIQAYVFTILAATYLGLSIQHADHGEDHSVHHAPDAPKTKVEAGAIA